MSITPLDLFKKYGITDELIVCKVDIEGGEEELFNGDTSWMENVVYLATEIHDRFDQNTKHSSIRFLEAIIKYDFAIIPGGIDTLYCYNRKFNFWE